MKFTKITAFVLVICMMIPLLASCKKEPTPAEVWNSAAELLAAATDLSLSAKVTLGEYTVSVDYAGNRTSGAKSYDIKIDDTTYPIYSDGTKNYYSAEDIKFSVKSSEDSDIMREFMSFNLTNAARLALEDEQITDALIEKSETAQKLTFKADGSTFKAMFAPDENISFETVTVAAELDLENSLKTIKITSKAKGTEFYGIPLLGADKEFKDLSVTVENIDFSASKAPKAPENTSEYPELVALAKTYPTGLFSSMKDSSKVETTIEMDMDVMIVSMKVKAVSTLTTQYIEGIKYTRNITKTTSEAMGQNQTTTEDEYYNGKDGYTYITDSEGANYKIKLEEEENSETDDILSIFTKDSNLEDVFKDATVAGSTITVNISGETLQKLMSDTSDSDLGMDLGETEATFKDTTLTIKLKNGLIETVSMDLEIEAEGDLMGTGTSTSVSVKASISMKYYTIMDDYVAEAPEGYENYEDWT